MIVLWMILVGLAMIYFVELISLIWGNIKLSRNKLEDKETKQVKKHILDLRSVTSHIKLSMIGIWFTIAASIIWAVSKYEASSISDNNLKIIACIGAFTVIILSFTMMYLTNVIEDWIMKWQLEPNEWEFYKKEQCKKNRAYSEYTFGKDKVCRKHGFTGRKACVAVQGLEKGS